MRPSRSPRTSAPKPAPRSITLRELRAYTGRTQIEAATATAMTQSQLSRLERRDDFLLSTLRRYVAALGGSLEVIVNLGSSSFRLADGEQATAGWQLSEVHTALEELSELKTWLPKLVASVPASLLRERRPECGAFSLLEHVCHVRDIDLDGYARRFQRTLGEDEPQLEDVDGDRLAVERDYQAQPLEAPLTALLASRKATLATLSKLRESSFQRKAVLEGVGPVDLGELVLRWRAHDVGHRVEMERLAATLLREQA